MKSPKFAQRAAELSKHLTAQELKSLWKSTIRASMRRQFIEDPIEYLDFHGRISEVTKSAERKILSGDYKPFPPKRILVEKSKGLCRQVIVPHVVDALVLHCLHQSVYLGLRTHAPHENAFYQPDHQPFNKNTGSASEYGGRQAWINFQKEILAFSHNRRFVVVTDIANYYDNISYSQLRNVLSHYLSDAKESELDFLIYLLEAMSWHPDYMPSIETGLPQIDLDAPRLLAHAFLFELDVYMKSQKDLDYARYMDDIDVGADEIFRCKEILRDIDLALQTRNLRLNSGKTKILSAIEAIDHFKMRENTLLDLYDEKMKISGSSYELKMRSKILRIINVWSREGRFDSGNGEKILKRLINMAAKYRADLDKGYLVSQFKLRPNLRETITRYLSKSGDKFGALIDLLRYSTSKDLVDDASAVFLADAAISIPYHSGHLHRKEITSIAVQMCLGGRSEIWLYSGLLILSRFSTQEIITSVIRKRYDTWKADYWLGRLVGGLYPILTGQRHRAALLDLISKSRNIGALEVRRFYEAIYSDPLFFNSVRKVIEAVNDSHPLGLTYGKQMIMLAVLETSAVPVAVKKALIAKHVRVGRDHFFRVRARGRFR